MSVWNDVQLKRILSQRKEQVSILPDTEYSLVTISNVGKISLREKKKGSLISAKKGFVTKAGDFIYSRLSVHSGAFGIVPPELDGALITNEMPCFQINEKITISSILIDSIGQPDFMWKLNQLTNGMGRVRIKEKMFLDLQIRIPDLQEQIKLFETLGSIRKANKNIRAALDYQKTLVEELRRQILQEAIEGKLTAEWRIHHADIEAATKLLKRIAENKAKLVKEKKIRARKPLPPVKDEEKPFAIPQGWEWCRIGEFSLTYVDCPHNTPKYQSTGYFCLRAPDVAQSGLLLNKIRRVSESEYIRRTKRLTPKEDDLIYIREGGRLGVAGLINTNKPVCLGQRVMLLRLCEHDCANYALFFLNAPKTFTDITEKTIGTASPHVNVRDIVSHVVPVPPLEEQRAIVSKVKRVLMLCDQLEDQIRWSQSQAEQLMKSALREAFTPKSLTTHGAGSSHVAALA